MPANSPPSIGKNLKRLKLVNEEHDLPGDRKQVVSLISKLLEQGGVQKLMLHVGQPIKLSRYVKADSFDPIKDLAQEDLYEAARLAEIEEHISTENNPYEILFDLFQIVSSRNKVAKIILVNNFNSLRKWLKLNKTMVLKDLYGVAVEDNKEMPEDVALLICTDPDDATVVTFSLKFFIDPINKGE